MATAQWTGWLRWFGRDRTTEPRDFESLSLSLLSEKGEASGVALASYLLASYSALPDESARRAFFDMLLTRFGPNLDSLRAAVAEFQRQPGDAAASRVHEAAESRRQELVRRMNLAPGATLRLVRMREDLLQAMRSEPALAPVDADFRHLFGSWFNRGFLVLQADRLDDAGARAREDHPLRGGARDLELGRPAPAHRAGRPPLLRVLPSGARQRAADLRRGGADAGDARRDRAAARSARAGPSRRSGRRRRCSIRSPTARAACAASRSAIS